MKEYLTKINRDTYEDYDFMETVVVRPPDKPELGLSSEIEDVFETLPTPEGNLWWRRELRPPTSQEKLLAELLGLGSNSLDYHEIQD